MKDEKKRNKYIKNVNRIFNLLEKHIFVEFISKIKDDEDNTIGSVDYTDQGDDLLI